MLFTRTLTLLFFGTFSVCAKEYTVSDMTKLSEELPEVVLPENDDYFAPRFNTYFNSMKPSIFKKIGNFFGVNKDIFSLADFLKTLEDVVDQQKSRGRLGDFLVATQLTYNDKIIILGNIQGAFHSLVRDIQEFIRQGIIDNTFKITDPKCRIVFNGTAVARSPYLLQTLFVILLLMKQNPDNVFYVESDIERTGLWKERGLQAQVSIMYPEHASRIFELYEKFILISPFMFCGNYEENPEKLFKITASSEFKNDVIENQTGDFFFQLKPDKISVFLLDHKEKNSKPVHTVVLIEGTDPTLLIKKMDPLLFLDPIEAAAVWRVFSSPTPVFEKLYGFNSDSFAKIIFGKELDSSIIESYVRNRTIKGDFQLKESFEVDSGIPAKPTLEYLTDLTPKIYIGSSFDLSKSNYIMGQRVQTGISLALSQVNKSGGIGPKKQEVQAIFLDDEYTPRIALDNINRLQKQFNVNTVVLPIGTPTILAAEELIKSGDILAAFPISGSPALRHPDQKGVVCYRPTFEIEVEILLNYLMKEGRLKSFAFFYPEDEYGLGCMKKAKEVLEANGITKWVELPYQRNTTSFEKHYNALKTQQVDALGCFSASLSTQEFLRQVGAATLSTLKLFAVAWAVDDVLESFIKNELGIQALISRDVPNPKFSQIDIVKEYRMLMDELKRPYDTFSLEAYICTSILCDMMQKVSGPITHTALIEQFEAVKNYNYKGLLLNFDPQDRQICKRVWLDFQDGQDWKEVL